MHRSFVAACLCSSLFVTFASSAALATERPAVAADPPPKRSVLAAEPARHEDWKGPSPAPKFYFGGLAGMGVLDTAIGFSLLGTAAIRLVERGFANDINNQVFLEGQAGPVFFRGLTAFQYHVHLRWDFNKNEDWTFYAIGGLGGILATGRTVFYPHFGVGAMWHVFARFSLRAELSHEFTGMGVVVPL